LLAGLEKPLKTAVFQAPALKAKISFFNFFCASLRLIGKQKRHQV